MADQFPYYIYTSTSKDQDMEAYEEYKFYENSGKKEEEISS